MKVRGNKNAIETALEVTGGAVEDFPAKPELHRVGDLMDAKHALNVAYGTQPIRHKRKPRPRDRKREKAARKANRR